MLTYTYIREGKFGLVEKPKPQIQHERDAIVKVTLASVCSSDLHIKHGSVPRAVFAYESIRITEQYLTPYDASKRRAAELIADIVTNREREQNPMHPHRE